MSIFHNSCRGDGGDSETIALPLIDILGTQPLPTGYEYLQGLSRDSYKQYCAPTDTVYPMFADTALPTPARGTTNQFGQGVSGAWRTEIFAGQSPANSLQFYPHNGLSQWVGIDAWPAAFAATGVLDILACELLGEALGVHTMLAVVVLDSTPGAFKIGAVRWTVESGATTITHAETLDTAAQSVPRSGLAFAPAADGVKRILRTFDYSGAAPFIVVDPDTAALSLCAAGQFGSNPGAASAALASLPDGTALVGSSGDNMIRARKYSIADVDGTLRVLTSWNFVVLAVPGIDRSDDAVAYADVFDTLTVIAPDALYTVTFSELGVPSVRQEAGRHPQLAQFGPIVPLCTFVINPATDETVLYVAEPQAGVLNGYTYRQLTFNRSQMLSGFVRKAFKVA